MDQLAETLTPLEAAAIVVSIMALLCGTSAFKSYLEERRKIKVEQLRNDDRRQILEAFTYQSEQETKRAEIIANLETRDNNGEQILQAASEAQRGIIKSVGAGDQGGIGESIILTKEMSKILGSNPK